MRGEQPVVLAAGRHLDVDDRDVGPVGERPAQEFARRRRPARRRRGRRRSAAARCPRAAGRRPRRSRRAARALGRSRRRALDQLPERRARHLVLRQEAARAGADAAAGGSPPSASVDISTTRTAPRHRGQRSARSKPSPSGSPMSTSAVSGPQLRGARDRLLDAAGLADHDVAPAREDVGPRGRGSQHRRRRRAPIGTSIHTRSLAPAPVVGLAGGCPHGQWA